MDAVEGARDQSLDHEAAVLARHPDVMGLGGNETEPLVVVGIADQYRDPVTDPARLGQRPANQGHADAASLETRFDGDRPDQQGRNPLIADGYRPIGDGPDEIITVPGREAQSFGRLDPFAERIGPPLHTIRPEGPVEKGVDRCGVGGGGRLEFVHPGLSSFSVEGNRFGAGPSAEQNQENQIGRSGRFGQG